MKWAPGALACALLAAPSSGCDAAKVSRLERRAPIARAPALTGPHRGHCGDGGWSTYGHDARRTSASDGCCRGPMTIRWRATLAEVEGRASSLAHAIADGGRVFAAGVRGNSPVIARFDDARGELAWVFDSRADMFRASWPTAAYGRVLLNDDGLYFADEATGRKAFDRGLDTWGETLADGGRYYLVNTWHVDGPGVFVGALDRSGKIVWKRNEHGIVRGDVLDHVGAVALDAGALYQAANYRYGRPSGVLAFDAATGEPRWTSPTQPRGHLSAGGGRVYLVEADPKTHATALVAREQRDGSIAWSTPVLDAWSAAPVVADDKIIVASEKEGVVAFRSGDGARAWATPVAKLTPPPVLSATALAAAVGSGTLLVASGDGLRLLSLDDGSEIWAGAPVVAAHSPVIVGRRAYVVSDGGVVALACE